MQISTPLINLVALRCTHHEPTLSLLKCELHDITLEGSPQNVGETIQSDSFRTLCYSVVEREKVACTKQ